MGGVTIKKARVRLLRASHALAKALCRHDLVALALAEQKLFRAATAYARAINKLPCVTPQETLHNILTMSECMNGTTWVPHEGMRVASTALNIIATNARKALGLPDE